MSSFTTWTLTDGSAGMVSQVIGLAEALGFPATNKLVHRQRWTGILPTNCTWRALMALTPDSDRLGPPYPDILVSCGRRSIALALALKKLRGDKIYTIHIQDPRCNCEALDTIIVPKHDRLRGPKVLTTAWALHRLNQQKLATGKEQFQARVARYPGPYTTVLLGGSTRGNKIIDETIRSLVAMLQQTLAATPGSLLITPSRRTDLPILAALRVAFVDHPRVWLVDLATEENPYMGFLAHASTILATDDSVNMISEACYTGQPVYILPFQGQKRSKARSFFKEMEKAGYVRPFSGNFERWEYTPLDEAGEIAKMLLPKIERLFGSN
jgi:mitochondrial fission protein ELM1